MTADATARFDAAKARWEQILLRDAARDAAAVGDCEQRLHAMRAEQADLTDRGRWVSGPRTLMAAVGRAYDEMALTAGLAWLCRADGHHRLGRAFLAALAVRAGVEDDGREASVVVEETRVDPEPQEGAAPTARADLVVYGRSWTLVVESKVFAPEQPHQADRLWRCWRDDPGVRFVFLTRTGRLPETAEESGPAWLGLSWTDVAALVRQVERDLAGHRPGVEDFATTLEEYHRV